MNTRIKNKIKYHAIEKSPDECCGFIINKDGKADVIQCENIARDPKNNFKISARDFLSIKNQYEILYCYHSHLDEENFSLLDKLTAKQLNLDLILYIKNKELFKYFSYNNEYNKNYIGKSFYFHGLNCFDLVKNYYNNELNLQIDFPKELITNNKLEINKNNFNLLEKYALINNLTFFQNKDLENNDILLLDMNGFYHLAVYLGGSKLLEQPLNGFSQIVNYTNYHDRKKVGVFRRNKNG